MFWIGLSLVAGVGACEPPAPDEDAVPDIPGPRPGQPLPDYAAFTLGGDTIRLDSFRGQVVLLNFWARWCTGCLLELPELQALDDELRSRGLRIVTVSMDRRDREGAERFLRANGYRWLNLFDYQTTVDRVFGWDTGIPKTILINRDGTIRIWWRGRLDAKLPRNREFIDAAIREPG